MKNAATPTLRDPAWTRLRRWIHLYSWAQVAFLAILLTTLHMVPLTGNTWSSCLESGTGATNWACVAFFHLYEVPLALFFVYHIYLGFRPITRATLPYYSVLTLFQLVLLFVFLTFESNTLLAAMKEHAPTWETALIFGGCTGMLVNSILGFYITFTKILPAHIGLGAAARGNE